MKTKIKNYFSRSLLFGNADVIYVYIMLRINIIKLGVNN